MEVVQKQTNIDVRETKKDYLEVFSNYDLNDKETIHLIDVIERVKNGEKFNIYDELPRSMQNIADGLRAMDPSPKKMTKNESAKYLISNFTNDAKINRAVDEYTSEMSSTIAEMGEEYDNLIKGGIDSIFSRIDEIREENPEKADQIEAIKRAFEDSITFSRQIAYLNTISAKKLKKFTKRYDNECFYFNKRVKNDANVVVPNIEQLLSVIKSALPQYEEFLIKEFIVVLSKSTYNLRTDRLEDIAYLYRLINNIYEYRFIDINNDKGKALFGTIAEVIDKIANL